MGEGREEDEERVEERVEEKRTVGKREKATSLFPS